MRHQQHIDRGLAVRFQDERGMDRCERVLGTHALASRPGVLRVTTESGRRIDASRVQSALPLWEDVRAAIIQTTR